MEPTISFKTSIQDRQKARRLKKIMEASEGRKFKTADVYRQIFEAGLEALDFKVIEYDDDGQPYFVNQHSDMT